MSPPSVLYRVGTRENVFKWRLPRLTLEASDPKDGSRWDAPHADFATLYFATAEVGAFVETLPYALVDDSFLERMRGETPEDEPEPEFDPDFRRQVTPDYFKRVLASVTLAGDVKFIDIDHPLTHAQLNRERLDLLKEWNLTGFDRGVAMTQDRRITRTLAGHLRTRSTPNIVGIRYESRRSAGKECWAVWERADAHLSDHDAEPLTPNTPGLREAVDLLDVALPVDV